MDNRHLLPLQSLNTPQSSPASRYIVSFSFLVSFSLLVVLRCLDLLANGPARAFLSFFVATLSPCFIDTAARPPPVTAWVARLQYQATSFSCRPE